MRPLDVYVETSVWNFLLVGDAPQRRELTHDFFGRAAHGSFRLFVSGLVLLELARTPDETRREQLLDQIRTHSPVEVPITPEAQTLAERYVLHGTIPSRYKDDALHVAVAVTSRLDAVVSWNLKHLVKLKTRREVNALSQLHGYLPIEIVTPEEVL